MALSRLLVIPTAGRIAAVVLLGALLASVVTDAKVCGNKRNIFLRSDLPSPTSAMPSSRRLRDLGFPNPSPLNLASVLPSVEAATKVADPDYCWHSYIRCCLDDIVILRDSTWSIILYPRR
jgi:hypothetical protein